MSATVAANEGAPADGAGRSEQRHSAISGPREGTLRVAFVGEGALLDAHAPSGSHQALVHACFPVPPAGARAAIDDVGGCAAIDDARAFEGDVTVVLDPLSLGALELESMSGVTLGVLCSEIPDRVPNGAFEGFDRLVSFDPALTGRRVGKGEVWRAIPPPVSDALFAGARALHSAPRSMSLGRSTAHREAMLMPAKHRHDLLQVCHGVTGEALAQLCGECDVGVYVGREWGGGFGWQVGTHLAAGHLLLAEALHPGHGLECDIDYLRIHSPEDLVYKLDRLARFPEMGRSVQVRGRFKAEHFRASRVFGRIAHDLLLDVAAFGGRTQKGVSRLPPGARDGAALHERGEVVG